MNALLYLGTVLIWGTTWYAITFQLGVVAPEVSVALRFLLAAVALFGWLLLRRQSLRLPPGGHPWVLLFGVLQFGVNFILLYRSETVLTSGVVSVVFSTITVMNIANAALIFGRRVDGQVALGAALGLAGIVTTFWRDLAGFDIAQAGSLGLVLALAGTLAASLGNMVSTRNQRAAIPVMLANAYGMLYAAVLVGLYAWATGASFAFVPTVPYVAALVYLALVGSIGGFGCYLTLLGRIGPERAAYSAILFPVVALALSTLLEGYVWTAEAVAGAGLILLGNLAVLAPRGLLRFGRPAPARPAAP
ncbi:MAG TPA: DMT family transporter [Alphaproteobacteria bacterium]|nr:DMT family transporter [Alphaproteobacteria bacterium]